MLVCDQCNTEFKPNKMKAQRFCTYKCYKVSLEKPKKFCKNCNNKITSKWAKDFCCRSCSTSFNNKKRDYGYRRSKLEEYIEEVVSEKTNRTILFNNKTIIGSELDIYVPDLKLAIEIQGIFHYQPVFGEEKFNSIKRNDAVKRKKCKELGIKLVEINTCEQNQFSIESSKKYVDFILELILIPSVLV
jgi:very-short-patch-repair endonuclease